MGIGGLAVLAVMFMDWYEPAVGSGDDVAANAWQAFTVNDVILALAAAMAVAGFVLTLTQPTAAVPLALSALTTLVAIIALVLVTIRVVWPPEIADVETARLTGAWLGLVASAVLTAGCLASLRDERVPQPEHPVEPRLVEP